MSETQTLTLTDFLLARIGEDEREANVMLRQYREGGDVSSGRWRRVLAECEAKRRIVEECEASASLAACQPRGSYDEGITTGLLAAMHALAAVYADHPDYRAEWAL